MVDKKIIDPPTFSDRVNKLISIWNAPLEVANAVNTFAWILAVVGAAVTLISIMALFWASAIRERYSDEKIATANATAENAKAEAAKVYERTAELSNEAAQAKLEQERLRLQLAGRRLSKSQFETIVANLTGLHITLQLSAIATDPESMLFAADIQKALAASGFKVQIQSSVLFGTGPIAGLIISGPKHDLIRVGNAFVKAGFNVAGQERPGDVEILVGSKPPPF